jgi:hypothetical protein
MSILITEFGRNPNSIEIAHYKGGSFFEIVVGPDECNSIGSEAVQLTSNQFRDLFEQMKKMMENTID